VAVPPMLADMQTDMANMALMFLADICGGGFFEVPDSGSLCKQRLLAASPQTGEEHFEK